MAQALVRPIGDSFRDAIRSRPVDIDVERAMAQHAAYVRALQDLGYAIRLLPTDEALPDGCFVEDQAVVVGRRALLLRVGRPEREAEAPSVAAGLRSAGLSVLRQEAGRVDGGDVLRVGNTLVVGRSSRTDEAGVDALRAAFPELEVREVDVAEGTLHLKCHCSSPAPGLVLVADGTVPPTAFHGLGRVRITPAEEAWGANTVGRGGKVLVAAGFPGVSAALRDEGLTPIEVVLDEIAKADGSPTCLSLLVEP
ncbi:MAG: hypothetical protein H6738_23185 [Alphaproteobacteria bacterium]|nr:hypothetical protein [Alphaproteobacteria bacterium]MCB9699709.1 hypothetical protein [Alphaproteobacteria bacterium]